MRVPFVEIVFPEAARRVVEREWRTSLIGPAVRLHGGEESAAFRLEDVVVRVGPRWRPVEEFEWCHAVAGAASSSVPQALAPIATAAGQTVALVEGRPVSVWPFVDGEWADDGDDGQRSQAATVLASIHRALARTSLGARPSRTAPSTPVPDVEDRRLDAWMSGFLSRRQARQPLHGDFYAGNVLVREGTIVAVLDWDEALLGPPELELAWAAWEWGDGLWADDFSNGFAFVHAYRTAGGTAGELPEAELLQVVRARLQAEVRCAAAVEANGSALDADDVAYRTRQIEMFHRLAALAGGPPHAP